MDVCINAVLAVLSVVLLSGSSSAQETTGTIAGRVTDTQGAAVAHASVTVIGPHGSKSSITDADGRFDIPVLIPATYDLRAELQGFKAVEIRTLAIHAGQTRELAVTLEPGRLTDTVEAIDRAAIVDLTSTTAGTVLDSALVGKIPIGRQIADTLFFAPGVSGTTAGGANASISGGSALDNLYVVDGISVTNSGYGAMGGYSTIFGSPGWMIPLDAAEEVHFKTGGYGAEFGQSMGGILNIVTKSGLNERRGSVFGYSRPRALEAAYRTYQTVNGTVNTVGQQERDFGMEIGGRLTPNRMFFFGAINPSWTERTLVAPKGFPLERLGDVNRTRHSVSYSTKVTYQAAPTQRFDLSLFGDPSEGAMGPQRASSLTFDDTSAFSAIEFGGDHQILRYHGGVGSQVLIESSLARAYSSFSEFPSVNEWRITDRTVSPIRMTGGVGEYEAGNRSKSLQYRANVTYITRQHTIKTGLLFDDVSYAQANQQTGPTFIAHTGDRTATGASITILPDITFGRIYRVTRASFDTARQTAHQYRSIFVQDQWRPADRLTINAGIRSEIQTFTGARDRIETTDHRFVDRFRLKHSWAPRIGFIYDVGGGGRTKLSGSWGRFVPRLPNQVAARALSPDATITRADYFDEALQHPIFSGSLTPTSVGRGAILSHYVEAHAKPHLVDPETRLPFKDELAFGYEWQAAPRTSVALRYLHRRIGRIVEDITPYPAVACDADLFSPACTAVYHLTNPTKHTPVAQPPGLAPARFEDPSHTYDAVEVVVDRRWSGRWSLTGSYRWSRLFGSYEGFFREDNGRSDAGVGSLYDFPTDDPSFSTLGHTRFGYRGDIRYLGTRGEGPLPLDRPHQVKVFGNYTWDNGLGVGLGAAAGSGRPLTALASLPVYDSANEIPETPRGAGFDTIDGFRKRTPLEAQIDLRASYTLNLHSLPRRSGQPTQAAKAGRLTLLADAFNLFNVRRPTGYDAATEISFQVDNPDFGTPTSHAGQTFQQPFALRLGARFAW